MVSITSLSGSSAGVLFYELPESVFKRVTPRLSKTKTLDGGVVFDHRGTINGDREFRIRAIIDKTVADALESIQANETYVNISCPAGFFLGMISSLSTDNGNLDMEFWVKE